MIRIFSQPEIKKYKAPINSKAFVFYILCTLIVFAGPLFVVYRTHGFWIKEATYREQPIVNFKYQAILLLQTSSRQAVWSTFTNLNSLQRDRLLSPLLRLREVDSNLDGKNDWLELLVEVPLSDSESVHSVTLLLVFDYLLISQSFFIMESLAVVQHSSSLPGSVLYVSGDLHLRQKQPIGYKGTDTRYSLPIVDSQSLKLSDYALTTIVSNYQRRNVSTALENALYLWEPNRPAGQPFRINATVWFPAQAVAYKPGFWYALKWGWIQYASLMLVLYLTVNRLKQFVLDNHIIPCIVQRPLLLDCKLRR